MNDADARTHACRGVISERKSVVKPNGSISSTSSAARRMEEKPADAMQLTRHYVALHRVPP
jgi:hypothetical protein